MTATKQLQTEPRPDFYSHPSARGDRRIRFFLAGEYDFYSHPSARGDQTYDAAKRNGLNFYSHPSARGDMLTEYCTVLSGLISTRTPPRGVTVGAVRFQQQRNISTRTPPRGVTLDLQRVFP